MASEERRRYARFYYERFISEYPHIYDSDALFACWMRLVVLSEQAWPNDPELPRSAKKSAITGLIEAGIVQVTGHRFHIRGFRAERIRRAESGKVGAAVRWHSDGNANALPSENERNASTRTSTSTKKAIQGVRPLERRYAAARVKPEETT